MRLWIHYSCVTLWILGLVLLMCTVQCFAWNPRRLGIYENILFSESLLERAPSPMSAKTPLSDLRAAWLACEPVDGGRNV